MTIIIILSALFVVGYVLAFVNYFSYKRCSSSIKTLKYEIEKLQTKTRDLEKRISSDQFVTY